MPKCMLGSSNWACKIVWIPSFIVTPQCSVNLNKLSYCRSGILAIIKVNCSEPFFYQFDDLRERVLCTPVVMVRHFCGLEFDHRLGNCRKLNFLYCLRSGHCGTVIISDFHNSLVTYSDLRTNIKKRDLNFDS